MVNSKGAAALLPTFALSIINCSNIEQLVSIWLEKIKASFMSKFYLFVWCMVNAQTFDLMKARSALQMKVVFLTLNFVFLCFRHLIIARRHENGLQDFSNQIKWFLCMGIIQFFRNDDMSSAVATFQFELLSWYQVWIDCRK